MQTTQQPFEEDAEAGVKAAGEILWPTLLAALIAGHGQITLTVSVKDNRIVNIEEHLKRNIKF